MNTGIMRTLFYQVVLSILLMLVRSGAYGQGFSYDGNRWYEIEVSIFTNQGIMGANPELFFPGDIELSYPERILELTPLSAFYAIDFSTMEAAQTLPGLRAQAALDSQLFIGPEYRAPNENFQLVDKARDPFIALGSAEHEFTAYNRNLNSSPNHRLLYHAVWRQPVLNKIQSSAILIRGGDRFGAHSELEGSLTISYNINRVDVDAHLWRNAFNISSVMDWNVPLPPLESGEEEENMGLVIERVYPMLQTRQMISNQLHYLDHPAFGMLIEVRPYELPPLFDFSLE